ISGEIAGELQLDVPVDGPEVGGFAGILPEGDLHGSVDGSGGAGAGDVANLNVTVDIANHKVAVDVPNGDAAFVPRLDADVGVPRDFHQEIHFHDVVLEFA